jgi:16S rRNA (uracil1498-N3)-methyltransferase
MTDRSRVATRLHVDAPLDAGTLELDADRTHFLRNVLRLVPGATIAVFNARDGEFTATIERIGKVGTTLAIGERRRAPALEPDPWLCFAPLKRARIDDLVEKATELGVARLVPVFTRRTIVERVNVERLRTIATEAAEQTERLSVPEIAAPLTLDALLAAWPEARTLVVGDESGGGAPIARLACDLRAPLAVLIGPEGGFASVELDALAACSFVRRVGLGPRVLRADTAALATLAVIQALAGDWNERPRFRSPDFED